ncbi:hypothetical protein ACJ41O_014964 [Fusarium nematophilum]
MSIKNVSLVGASGNIGGLVIPELLKSSFSFTAVTRTASTSKFPPGIKVAKSDFTLNSLTEIFKGQDAVISMLPMTALGDQGMVIEAAIAAGNDAVIAAVPFFEGKKKYLEYLKSKQDAISWTGLITGPFFDWGLGQGFLGFNLAAKTAMLVDEGKTRFTATNGAQIGRALAAVLSHASETANKMVFVESFTTTQLEILAVLEKASGEKFQVVNVKSEYIRAEGAKQIGEGNIIEGGGKLITAVVLGKESLEDHSHVDGGIWNDRLGLPKENLEEEVTKVLQEAVANK